MRKAIACFILVITVLSFGSGQAYAAEYKSDLGVSLTQETVEARAFLKQTADRLCGPDDSDLEKVRKLNQYVCDKVDYDDTVTAGGLDSFVNKDKVFCTGYTEALAYLLDCVNVKNFTMTGYVRDSRGGMVLHIWNVVFLDGKWLHVDATWNDATRSRANPDGKYFLLSPARISSERQITLKTEKSYDSFYDMMRTVQVTLNIQASGSLIDGQPFAPLTATVSALGGYVMDGENGSASVILGTKTLELTADSGKGTLDGREVTFEAFPQLSDGKLMIPVREILELLGATVDYNNSTAEFIIFYDWHRNL